MKKKVLVVAPALSRSGYGEQARFAIKCLASAPSEFEVFIQNIPWGRSGWIDNNHPDRSYIDERIVALGRQNTSFKPDISLQVTIPNEFKVYAPVNIGYTAGVETDRMNPEWLISSNIMNGIIVVSSHTEGTFKRTTANTNKNKEVKLEVPIITIGYPKTEEVTKEINLDLITTKFNFLSVAQMSPRKNINSSIKCFIEEFAEEEEVGFVLKVHDQNCSMIDRYRTKEKIRSYIENLGIPHKCKIYLLHGDISPAELSGLYANKKIHSFITTAHGEGFGLPIFEAACAAVPIISPDWGGQRDFLYAPHGKKLKNKACFMKIDHTLKEVSKESIWPGVIEEDAKWAFPCEKSTRACMRKMKNEYGVYRSLAKSLKKNIEIEHTFEKKSKEFIRSIIELSNQK